MAMKEAAEKNSAASAAFADGGSDAGPPTSAAAARNVIGNANAVAARLEERLNDASRLIDPDSEEVIDGARAVSELRDVIGGASALLVRTVTWTEDLRAIFVLGDVMVDTSAANVPGDVINDANAITMPEKTSGDPRRVSRLEYVIGSASPIDVLGAVLSGASGVSASVLDGASALSVWKKGSTVQEQLLCWRT